LAAVAVGLLAFSAMLYWMTRKDGE
jgi:hypothetical protein